MTHSNLNVYDVCNVCVVKIYVPAVKNKRAAVRKVYQSESDAREFFRFGD